jgi:hypothetical protein
MARAREAGLEKRHPGSASPSESEQEKPHLPDAEVDPQQGTDRSTARQPARTEKKNRPWPQAEGVSAWRRTGAGWTRPCIPREMSRLGARRRRCHGAVPVRSGGASRIAAQARHVTSASGGASTARAMESLATWDSKSHILACFAGERLHLDIDGPAVSLRQPSNLSRRHHGSQRLHHPATFNEQECSNP